MTAKRKDNLEKSFADRLIDAGEVLFGEHGLTGISLRQIASAAGNNNNYAVQYHFGSLNGFLQAIIEQRSPAVELRRGQLLEQVITQGKAGEMQALVGALFLPLIEHKDSKGKRAYARFTLALLNSSAVTEYNGVVIDHPNANTIIGLLRQANPDVPAPILWERLRHVSTGVLTSLFNRLKPFDQSKFDAALVEDVLRVAAAALSAPVGQFARMITQGDPVKKNAKRKTAAKSDALTD